MKRALALVNSNRHNFENVGADLSKPSDEVWEKTL